MSWIASEDAEIKVLMSKKKQYGNGSLMSNSNIIRC